MKFLGFLILIFPIFAQAADVYGKHHMCIKNPQDSYMTGDATKAFPNCLYAVIDVSQELLDQSNAQQMISTLQSQVATLNQQVSTLQTQATNLISSASPMACSSTAWEFFTSGAVSVSFFQDILGNIFRALGAIVLLRVFAWVAQNR